MRTDQYGRHTCIEAIDEALKPKGVRLSIVDEMRDDRPVKLLRVMVEDIEAGSGASDKKNMIASHCPFCGVML